MLTLEPPVEVVTTSWCWGIEDERLLGSVARKCSSLARDMRKENGNRQHE